MIRSCVVECLVPGAS